ncbi:MAG: lipopolysaccharide biosynthesis [Defluviimonas sp.]|uniref:GumC family protein n=1 Tax=Albidovulum sp. TaxID=1872424 RepID=UPI002A350441|nr:lipopolysaccharide biosynthesis [Defluviimonas sp.]
MNIDLSFYMAVFMRRLHYFILIFTLVLAAALAAAFLLPRVYVSSSTLLVDNSKIPISLDAPRVQAAALEKLQKSEQLLMTRANLLDIAKRLNVFSKINRMSPDEIVDEMRKKTSILKSAAPGEATIMEIGFAGETGAKAAGVVNEYVTFILKADVEERTGSAEDTLNFFDTEVKRLGGELDVVSARILKFQDENRDALPDTLNYRLGQQQLLQDRLQASERNIQQLSEQKSRMIAIFNSTGQINSPTASQTPEAQQLDQMRGQLTSLLAVFSPENPKVKLLKQQIKELEKVVKAQIPQNGMGAPGGAKTFTTASMLDVQLADLDTRVEQEKEQREKTIQELAALKDTIDRTPANQIALDALNRDYKNIQDQYNIAVSKQAAAAAGEQIELEAKGERLIVIEAATVPDRPSRPNRLLIAIGGFFGGAFLGFGGIVLIELLNRAVRRPKDLIDAFGITPIVTIPYMRTPNETMMRRTAFTAALLAAVIGIPAILYAIHVYYQPLDILFAKVALKFGIRL